MATVLVVDDEFGISELLEAIITDEGYSVVTAMNGKHAMEVLAQEPVDLIFLDFMMPVMDGAAMLNAMAADPTLRQIPVVMMSSMPEATIAERCTGYIDFMRKPFRLAQIVRLTQQLLGKGDSEAADPVSQPVTE